jgi:cobalt/nickel transport protein
MMTTDVAPRRRIVMQPRMLFALASVLGLASAAPAHFNMLLPQASSAKKGEPVTLTYQWGHPFEHQLFDAPAPEEVAVRTPDGKRIDLTQSLEKVTVASGDKKATAYRLKFTPEERGDYVFVLRTPAIWMEEDGEYLQDLVKVVLHVQQQNGWDRRDRPDFEFVPLTRPYGLRPGTVFQARVTQGEGAEHRAFADKLVEIERYNAAPPKELPPDEQITHTAKTDPNGVVTATLSDAGWWCLTAARPGGMMEREGKKVPLRQRSTLWVYVDEKPAK